MASDKIIISQQNNIYFINSSDIVFCQSENCYTFLNLADGKKIIVVKSLSKFAREQLSLPEFIRVSQSYLINRNFIINIDKRNKHIILVNNQSIPFTVPIKELLSLLVKETR